MTISQFIRTNKLQPGDALELICPQSGFPRHYAVFLGYQNKFPSFIANITDGVQILSNEQLSWFVKKYAITSIERFKGNAYQRRNAINRAFSRINEKAYNIIFNNCEHFKNWVLYGQDTSKQVITIGATAAAASAGLFMLGEVLDSKILKKAGVTIGVLLSILIALAFILWRYNQNQQQIRLEYSRLTC